MGQLKTPLCQHKYGHMWITSSHQCHTSICNSHNVLIMDLSNKKMVTPFPNEIYVYEVVDKWFTCLTFNFTIIVEIPLGALVVLAWGDIMFYIRIPQKISKFASIMGSKFTHACFQICQLF